MYCWCWRSSCSSCGSWSTRRARSPTCCGSRSSSWPCCGWSASSGTAAGACSCSADRPRRASAGQRGRARRCCVVMAVGIELEPVRRKTGGRVHLTPHVPDSGPVVTLCGQTFAEGTYEAADAEADCRNCLRRRDDPARVSSAFFESDVGAELLQRSLEQARARQRQERPARPARERGSTEPRPAAPKPAPARAE